MYNHRIGRFIAKTGTMYSSHDRFQPPLCWYFIQHNFMYFCVHLVPSSKENNCSHWNNVCDYVTSFHSKKTPFWGYNKVRWNLVFGCQHQCETFILINVYTLQVLYTASAIWYAQSLDSDHPRISLHKEWIGLCATIRGLHIQTLDL